MGDALHSEPDTNEGEDPVVKVVEVDHTAKDAPGTGAPIGRQEDAPELDDEAEDEEQPPESQVERRKAAHKSVFYLLKTEAVILESDSRVTTVLGTLEKKD